MDSDQLGNRPCTGRGQQVVHRELSVAVSVQALDHEREGARGALVDQRLRLDARHRARFEAAQERLHVQKHALHLDGAVSSHKGSHVRRLQLAGNSPSNLAVPHHPWPLLREQDDDPRLQHVVTGHPRARIMGPRTTDGKALNRSISGVFAGLAPGALLRPAEPAGWCLPTSATGLRNALG